MTTCWSFWPPTPLVGWVGIPWGWIRLGTCDWVASVKNWTWFLNFIISLKYHRVTFPKRIVRIHFDSILDCVWFQTVSSLEIFRAEYLRTTKKMMLITMMKVSPSLPRVYGFARICAVYMNTMKMKLGTNILFFHGGTPTLYGDFVLQVRRRQLQPLCNIWRRFQHWCGFPQFTVQI